MKTEFTPRGFINGEIASTDGELPLSVQESSSADTNALWIGVREPTIMRFTPNNERVPYTGEGLWETLDAKAVIPTTPNGYVSVFGRAHLDRRAVRELSKTINYWLRHGRLPTPEAK